MISKNIIRIQNCCTMFSQLNKSLNEAWHDVASEKYRTNIIAPIERSNLQFLEEVSLASNEIDKLIDQLENQTREILKEVDTFNEGDYPHKGHPIINISGKKHPQFMALYSFIVTPEEFLHISRNENVAKEFALTRHPDIIEIESVHYSGKNV